MVDERSVELVKISQAPSFCPRCGRPGKMDAILCDECGESLAPEGYCPVCEHYWPQIAGTSCPKHEITLDDAASPVSGSGTRIDWITLAAFPQTGAAEASRIRLEAEGIPTFLEGERMGNQGIFQIATGGVRLQVPRELAEEARVILSQTWVPDKDESLDDAWEEFEPEPGAKRRTIMKWVIVFILVLPLFQAAIMWLTW